MNTVIIRTCKRDDYLAKLCYESFIKAGIEAKYYFFAENDIYEHIKACGIPIIYRGFADNVGGRSNVVRFVEDLKQFNITEDYVIISDSDIFVLKDFTNILSGDLCGYVGNGDQWHVSGQMQIMKHDLFNELLKQPMYELCSEVVRLIDCADDTVFSHYAIKTGRKIQNLERYWLHDKEHYKKINAYELKQMLNSVHLGTKNASNETWRKAFILFNLETKDRLQLTCHPCYMKVLLHFTKK